MNSIQIVQYSGKALLAFSALAIGSVSVMAFANPQSVMDLVQVQLTNTDAYSSIRGVYGGVSFAIVVLLTYCFLFDVGKGLAFISVLWGAYAVSRIITHFVEGQLGTFGRQWLLIESALCVLAVLILLVQNKLQIKPHSI
jgi:hypothetical protein